MKLDRLKFWTFWRLHIGKYCCLLIASHFRVEYVWFQNRRSKERRMKQLSAMGARRQFFRSPRRLRVMRPGEDFPDGPDIIGSPGIHAFFGGQYYNWFIWHPAPLAEIISHRTLLMCGS